MADKTSVIDYWLSCVREQDIQKTSLTGNVSRHQFVSLDDESAILSNQRDSVKIKFSTELRDVLKKERTRQLYRNNKDSRPVFFFPLITVNGQSHPLFFVDLADLESQIMSGTGDLSFDINPWSVDTKIGVVSDTFAKLGYDEENIDLNESVISFIEKITGSFTLNFQMALTELLDFIKEDAKSSTGSYAKVTEVESKGLIKYSDFSEATLIFKKDLLYIKENPSLLNSTMVDNYINKRSAGVEFTSNPFIGGFFDSPMSEGQAAALSEVMYSNRELISVQGGPGTGKTTLILSVIAAKLARKAIALSKGEDQKSGLILVTSFNNKAVENVANILEREFGDMFPEWLCLQLGNREKRELAVERIDALIKRIDEASFDRAKFEKLKGFLVKAEKVIETAALQKNESSVDYSPVEISTLRSLGYTGEMDSKSLTEFLFKILKSKKRSISAAISSLAYSIKTDKQTVDDLQVKKVIIGRKIAIYKSLAEQFPLLPQDYIFSSKHDSDEAIRSEASQQQNGLLTRVLAWMGISAAKNPAADIAEEKRRFNRKIESKSLLPYPVYVSQIAKVDARVSSIERRLKNKQIIRSVLGKITSSSEVHTSIDKIRLNHVQDNKAIFLASLHLLYETMVKNKFAVIEALSAWRDVLAGKGTESRLYHDNFSDFINRVSMAFPVTTCTLSSLGSVFDHPESTYVNTKPFELSVCDEAGVVPIFCMPSILIRSKQGLVIGDQKQLLPIISIDKTRLAEFASKAGLSSGDSIYNPMLSSAFQRCAFAQKSNYADIGESVILNEHRRCQSDISDCFIEIGGYTNITNLTPVLEDEDLELYASLSAHPITMVDVKGANKGKRNVNFEEVDAIEALLDDFEAKGIDLKSQVGIITPFQNQSTLIQSRFRKRLGHDVYHKKIGTVHAFQGAEFDIIILSMVVYNSTYHVQFISGAPNLLNVAVSRSKNRLFIVGDRTFLEQQSGHIETLMKHAH